MFIAFELIGWGCKAVPSSSPPFNDVPIQIALNMLSLTRLPYIAPIFPITWLSGGVFPLAACKPEFPV